MDFETLDQEINNLLNQEAPPLGDLREAILEIDEYINSAAYQELDNEARSRLQNGLKELKARVRQQESGENPTNGGEALNTPGLSADTRQPAGSAQTPQAEARAHNPGAEQQMEEAEKLFYSGRYADAIKFFDKVLQIEPAWERAKQHRAEAENYMRTGYIPAIALPSDAASAFGKAQSASRVGRYRDALNMLEKAQAILHDLGITRWQDGQEFEQKLQENIDAENVYEEGLRLFNEGRLDEAIERVETASRVTGLPKYEDKAQELRKFKDGLRAITDTLNTASIEPKTFAQAKTNLDTLLVEHPGNPVLQKLKGRFDSSVPRAVEPLKEQAKEFKSQAEKSPTLEGVISLANQAKQQLDQIRNLGAMDEALDRLQAELDKLVREAQKYQNDLQAARLAFENNRKWPAQAARLSTEVRSRFPNDPVVASFNRSLGRYFTALAGIRFGTILVGIIILGFLVWLGIGRVQAYMVSLTPTATATPTITPTFTPTSTWTPTPTRTPSPTFTPTLTPTPMYGITLRDIWARNGCYESFTATGKIPTGAEVRFLPSERRFDTFNRECILVEFRQGETSVIGWVLLVDLQGVR
jgi:tetratricopeptide (TPR) repeat protein